MRQTVILLLALTGLLSAGCLSPPVTDFVLDPDSHYDAPHPISYQNQADSVSFLGGEVQTEEVSWSAQDASWTLTGQLTITDDAGETHETDRATVSGGGMSGSGGGLTSRGPVVVTGSSVTLGDEQVGGSFQLEGDVSVSGEISSDVHSGSGSISADFAEVDFTRKAMVNVSGNVASSDGESDRVMGARVQRVTFTAEGLQIRDATVDGQVSLHLSHVETLTLTPDGDLTIDAEAIQLFKDREPKLGCRIEIEQEPAAIEVPPGGEGDSEMHFKVVGPGSAVGLRSVAEEKENYTLQLSMTRPLGTDENFLHNLGLLLSRPDLAPGATYQTDVVFEDENLQGDHVLPLELRARNCPTTKIMVDVTVA